MSLNSIACPKCNLPIPEVNYNNGNMQPCGQCGTQSQIEIYPALLRPIETTEAEKLLEDSQASCFYHEDKKADQVCDSCGRFVCGLCSIDMGGKNMCPSCISSGKSKGKFTELENKRQLWDSIALSVATIPLIFIVFCWMIIPVTSLISIFICIKYWNAPLSILPRTKVRFIFAALISLLEFIGFLILIFTLISS